MLEDTGIHTVPVVHQGAAQHEQLLALIGDSVFESQFDNPLTGVVDSRQGPRRRRHMRCRGLH